MCENCRVCVKGIRAAQHGCLCAYCAERTQAFPPIAVTPNSISSSAEDPIEDTPALDRGLRSFSP
eukprot:365783-Chlamydomonas_euryale.AAC.17